MRRSLLILVVVLGLVSSACGGGGGPDFTIGFKRLALELAYKDEKVPEPTVAGSVTLPDEVSFLAPTFVAPSAKAPSSSPRAPACPTADPDTKPLQPATVFVTNPPALGAYTTHVAGYAEIGAATPIRFPLPPRGAFEVRNVKESTNEDAANGYTEIIEYDLFTPALDGGTTASYRVTYSPATTVGTVTQAAGVEKAAAGEMLLTHLVVDSTANKLDFRPDPPVTIISFRSGQGTTWSSAGTDSESGTSMVVQGSVSRRVNVDVCGQFYDTYEVISNEHIVNLETGFRSDTDAQDPNVYRVATNYGGLFIQSHRHITTTVTDPDGTPVSVTVNYDETFDSVKPLGAP
ncbi:MAG TPA: hypothetical protein VMZ22_06885 [Acidimicrobiales bacterium]|nr:hypothetical protein [Acidimicrobiales bacterium]